MQIIKNNKKPSISQNVLFEKGISRCGNLIRVIRQQLPKFIFFTVLMSGSVPADSLAEPSTFPPGQHATQPVSQRIFDSELAAFRVITRLDQVAPNLSDFAIPFFSFISAQGQPVPDNQAQQEGECTYQYGCIVLDHWFVLFNLFLVVSGALISPWVFRYDRHLKWPDFPRINPPESDYHPKTQEGPKKRPGEL